MNYDIFIFINTIESPFILSIENPRFVSIKIAAAPKPTKIFGTCTLTHNCKLCRNYIFI